MSIEQRRQLAAAISVLTARMDALERRVDNLSDGRPGQSQDRPSALRVLQPAR
jgi:hypothetical protein